MKLPFFRKNSLQGLTATGLFDHSAFYKQFMHDIANCQKELIIESPFITTRRMRQLLPAMQRLVARGVHVIVNTRHPNEHDEYLKSEAEVSIALMQDAGVNILFTGGHHRKIAIVDRAVLWEGSLNILSHNESCEIMRRINSCAIAQDMLSFLKLEQHLN